MALQILRTQTELRARHRQARRRDTIEADEYTRQIESTRHEQEDYRDIDRTAKSYLGYMLRNIKRTRWLHVRQAIGQYVAWKWMLGHADADTFAAQHSDPRHAYIYLRDQIESGAWDRMTKETVKQMRGSR
jgi:hypothetical protein